MFGAPANTAQSVYFLDEVARIKGAPEYHEIAADSGRAPLPYVPANAPLPPRGHPLLPPPPTFFPFHSRGVTSLSPPRLNTRRCTRNWLYLNSRRSANAQNQGGGRAPRPGPKYFWPRGNSLRLTLFHGSGGSQAKTRERRRMANRGVRRPVVLGQGRGN